MSNQVSRNSWFNYIPTKVDEIFSQDPSNVFSLSPDNTAFITSWQKQSGYDLFEILGSGIFRCKVPGLYRIECSMTILRTAGVDSTMISWITLDQNNVVDQHRYGETGGRYIDPTDQPGFFVIHVVTDLYLNEESVVYPYIYNGEGNFDIANDNTATNNGSRIRFSLVSK